MSDLRYVLDLAKKNTDALGFIPTSRLEEYDRNGQVLMATENDESCGFLVFGAGRETMRVYQACIQYDARRREHGLALVRRLVDIATRRGVQGISLWCADDLESNDFWRSAGFTFAGQRVGGHARARLHNRWVMPIAPDLRLNASLAEGIVSAPTINRNPRAGRTLSFLPATAVRSAVQESFGLGEDTA